MIKPISSTIVSCGINLLAYYTLIHFFPQVAHKQFYAFLLFFAGLQLLTAFAYYRLGADKNAEKFVGTFLVATGVKFILSLFIVLILVMKFPEQKQVLALSFCAQYMVFLVIDSAGLLSKIKERN